MRVEKPLLGFGWMGWVLLAIAGALVVVWVTGYDLQYQVLAITHTLFGEHAMNLVVARFFVPHSFNATMIPAQLCFGLWGICAVCFAFWVYPRPIRWWKWCVLIALGLISPSFWWDLNNINIRVLKSFGSTDFMLPLMISEAMVTVIFWLVLTFVTRSRTVAICIAIFGLCTMVRPITMYYYGLMSVPTWISTPNTYFAKAWNPILLAILLAWAIPARIRYFYETHWWLCAKCRYDMRDLGTTTCPECGVVNERMPAPEAGAAAADS